VAGRLHGDTEAVGGGVADRRDDVVDGGGRNDDLGLVVDGEVVARALGVVAGIDGGEEVRHAPTIAALTCGNNDESNMD
jgi:hypothetical protein